MHEKCKDEQLKRILQNEPSYLPHSVKQQIHFTLYRLPKHNRTLFIVMHYLMYGAIFVLAALIFLFFFLWNAEKTEQTAYEENYNRILDADTYFSCQKGGNSMPQPE
ncbi:hypothetical protein LCM00_02025 [Bacillus infantis]|uniref:hypothetical protein n=1 Tax=Bacillus infantis TaxID=324767 RepID=UPI001CD716B4|nr:hypothetical protein [Bacillus infantis]MCA1038274.1 hypothetical protein [Bacillus infantis]